MTFTFSCGQNRSGAVTSVVAVTGLGRTQRLTLDSGYCETLFSFHYGPLWAVAAMSGSAERSRADLFLTGGVSVCVCVCVVCVCVCVLCVCVCVCVCVCDFVYNK